MKVDKTAFDQILMTVTIYKGKPMPEDWKQIGAMIEDGYICGIDSPPGINWTLETEVNNGKRSKGTRV